MKLNMESLRKLMEERGWSEPMLAMTLGLNYTYVYRALRNQRKSPYKLFVYLIAMCEKEGLNYKDYITLEIP